LISLRFEEMDKAI